MISVITGQREYLCSVKTVPCSELKGLCGTTEHNSAHNIIPPYCKWTNRILAEVISKAAPPVFQIGLRCITPVENIINRFIHPGVPDWLLLIEPRPESLQNRFFLLETQLLSLFIITGILCVNGVLNGE